MTLRLLTLLALLAAPDGGPPEPPAPPLEPPAAAPALEVVIPEQALQELLTAASPFDREVKRTVNVLGFTRDVSFTIRLTRPRVRVLPSGVHVTLDYAVGSATGLGTNGVIRPRLDLRPDPKTGELVARLVDATVPSTGAAVPLEDVLEPIRFPATARGPLQLGGRRIDAEGRATDIRFEDGAVRVFGEWSFRPAAAARRR